LALVASTTPRGAALPDLTEKALVGAVSVLIAGRLMNGKPRSCLSSRPQIVELILIPYLGPEEASRVARA
jgi:hypothetical protein